jgi:hypothetical protein
MFNTDLKLDRQDDRALGRRDKSYYEDYIMRLYEFTDPTKYLPSEPDAADLLKQTKNLGNDDPTDNTNLHLWRRTENKKTTDTI